MGSGERNAAEYGQIAYKAYCDSVGGQSVHGERLPTWAELAERKPPVAEGWTRAAAAVRSASLRDFADLIDRGGPAPLKPSTFSTMARETADEVDLDGA